MIFRSIDAYNISMEVKYLDKSSSDYPKLLGQAPGAPEGLYVRGDTSLLNGHVCIAIVGSRKVTSYGRMVTEKLAGDLARLGVIIVSGLALGVDGIAHRAALDVGGRTIAVLPASLGDIYPATHVSLARKILMQGGALLTEYNTGTSLLPYCFIARNRIISGLSVGTIITEAAAKSGSRHTANFALEQGREVMAVPGSIFSPLSAGTNNLIRSGASPVATAQDVLDILDLGVIASHRSPPIGLNDRETTILRILSDGDTIPAERLLSHSLLSPSIFSQTLTTLEIHGRVKPSGDGGWRLV